jgi:hypothetical protein
MTGLLFCRESFVSAGIKGFLLIHIILQALDKSRYAHDAFTLINVDKAHAFCVSTDNGNILYADTDDFAAAGNDHQIVFFHDLLNTDHIAVAFIGLNGNDAFAAARLSTVFCGI